jgi:hypothetical protein
VPSVVTGSALSAEPLGQGVPEQHNVADLPDSGQGRPAVGVPGETPVADEPGRAAVTHEQRRHHEVQFVREVRGEELGEDGPPAG